jgi:thioesterase domain-containing protein
MQDRFPLQAGDRVLQKNPHSLDVSVWEFFGPITCGATLVIAEPGRHDDPAYIASLIGAERITAIHFAPSMLREFLGAANLARCGSLKRVFTSGEPLPTGLLEKFYRRLGAELHRLYGPEEAAGVVAHWDCSEQALCATVPAGRPISNVKAYILDQHLAPVPVGVEGELHIGGVAVARGYLNRGELTAERFIPDPFDRRPSRRLYKTGDRARFLADGNIEYLGRLVPGDTIPPAFDGKTLSAPELRPEAQRKFVPPQDEIEERLLTLWNEVLGVYPIGVTDNYFDLGGHSLLALRLFSEIKFCFQLELPLATLFHAPTIRTMAGVIRDSGVQAAAPIVPIQTNGTKPAIFCIGALNGEVILFRRLALELGPDQPLYGLQPFSLLDRLSTVETLAGSYIEQLRQWGEHRPFCLLGYSFGGLVAVEMARQLREAGTQPPLVALIDASYLAGCKAHEPWRDRVRRYRHHVHQIVHGERGFYHLADRIRANLVRKIHKVSTTLGVEAPRIASDIAGRQLLAAESYRAKPYPGPVCLFKAESQPEFFGGDQDLGWGEVLTDLRIEEIPGDHTTIKTGINLQILAQKLTAAFANLPSSKGAVQKAAAAASGD